ncbi:uncharacterized protein LOC123531978 [Mercenaria mercenaria]|uniref:uncharacterized protein LOC123531978 n=1 Tax=Mercenaria mercenaria TaxID=6596 RepID=UPI00234E7A36|nr:uncharacterized protein LOC123531978 [Mercenaria mercenaria]
MSDNTVTNTVEDIRKLVGKFTDNHHEIEDLFNQGLNKALSKSEIRAYTVDDCNELITELDHALGVVEDKVNHTLINVKDRLKQAKIDALERILKHCTCQDVMRREGHKRANIGTRKYDSGVGLTCSTDSRIFSDSGEAPVVQPTDASKSNNCAEDDS